MTNPQDYCGRIYSHREEKIQGFHFVKDYDNISGLFTIIHKDNYIKFFGRGSEEKVPLTLIQEITKGDKEISMAEYNLLSLGE